MSGRKNSSVAVSKKAPPAQKIKSTIVREPSSLDKHENVTIRLSDLGIIKRSPSQLDLQIQGAKIDYILESTINKLQMAVCLPRLLRHNACQLRRYMETQDVEFIVNICNKYLELPMPLSNLTKGSLVEILSSMHKISMHESKQKFTNKFGEGADSYADPYMGRVLETLWRNQPLRDAVKAEFPLIPKNPCTELVDSLRKLKDIAAIKFSVSGFEEKSRNRRLRKFWKANDLLEEKIRKSQEILDAQRQNIGVQVEIKKEMILKLEAKIEALKNKFQEDVKQITENSEKELGDDVDFSDERQIELSADAKSATQQYETLLTQHMGVEKMLRAKRFKVETQLCGWLAKYDADIGERQAEFDELTEGYEAEKAIVDGIQAMIDEQDNEYQMLWEQKEEEEQLMWEARAYEYLQNRSARKIQRCWRDYRQRKIDRKKAKKAKALARKQKKLEKAARKEAAAQEAAASGEKPGGKGKKGKGKGKGKAKGKGKGKKDAPPPSEGRGPDFQAVLENKFGDDLLGDLKGEEFSKKEVVVDLAEGLDDD